VQAYLACISYSDSIVGRILDALEGSPHRENTIVTLWSDHGYHLGEKWHWHKQSLWDRATRVPLMISAPGVTKPGSRCDRPVSLVDLYPTLSDLAGLPQPQGLDGLSLRPLLQDPARGWERPALITYHRGNHALRSDRWSYIRYHDGSEELYDRRQDPQEWINLADRPQTAKVKEDLKRWLPKSDAPGKSIPTGVPAANPI
jgi:arylsulfatase A-like enzyme